MPGIIQQVYRNYHGVAWYWHSFRVEGDAYSTDQRLLLRFGAVDYHATVWLNGKYIGEDEGGEVSFEFDVTDAIRRGQHNLLAVRVLNPTLEPIDGYALKETPHSNKTYPLRPGSGYNSGGIVYPVELRLVPTAHIADLFVRPSVNSGVIVASVTIHNSQPADETGMLALSVSPSLGGRPINITEQMVHLPCGLSEHELLVTVPGPRLWNLDDPYLYTVSASVKAGSVSHEHAVRCGFRDFCVVDGFFHLNGKRVFLKSTHTGNALPGGPGVPMVTGFARRDMLYAKASGFNMVRFIAGTAQPEQLDFCDEIGLMVYEECRAAWLLEDSPQMGKRFDRNTLGMVRRDRNHPSITIWGLLNETGIGPVFQHAVDFLTKLRDLDPTRLVVLSSGRWDAQLTIGTVSNPGSGVWEPLLGAEGPDAPIVDSAIGTLGKDDVAFIEGAGDAHLYPPVPLAQRSIDLVRAMGLDTKPVYLSEFGIGSLFNVINEWRYCEQAGLRPDLVDVASLREQSEAFIKDWETLGFDGVYAFPEDMLRESQRLHTRQRAITFDLVRSNPQINGYNLTGMLDHGMTGEGLWTFWREWKRGTYDAVADGWAPLRWCLFVDPLHGYSGREFTVEAVLASEDALAPGDYPARFRIVGPGGVVWDRRSTVTIPAPAPLAVPVLLEKVKVEGPAGQYILAANLESGGAPRAGRLAFHVSDTDSLPVIDQTVTQWGLDSQTQDWLQVHGLACRVLDPGSAPNGELILVGFPAPDENKPAHWTVLAERVTSGSVVLFLDPQVFDEGSYGKTWLSSVTDAQLAWFTDWLYHKECVAKRHPVFDGLPGPGILDWDYYGPIIPHYVFEWQSPPDETIATSFTTGHHRFASGYSSNLLTAMYRLEKGCFILNTLGILKNLDNHPAADRLLLNLVRYAARKLQSG